MSIPGSASPLFLASTAAAGAYDIPRSLRFNSADSSYLNRTPSSAGNRKTWTLSFWIKRVKFGGYTPLIDARNPLNDSLISVLFNSNDELELGHYSFSSIKTSRKYRDPSSWYHIVLAVDTTQGTASNRIKVYTNGVQEDSFTASSYPSQNTEYNWNTASLHTINQAGSSYGDQYFAEVNSIDGVSGLTATDFGEYDDNNVWQPIEYAGTYGTNGFHLDFSDTSSNSALGTDSSGQGNNWTVNNLSVAAGAGNDALRDSPVNGDSANDTGAGGEITGNYAVINPLGQSSNTPTISDGNLQMTLGAVQGTRLGTIGVSSGKYYFEVVFTASSVFDGMVGVASEQQQFTLGGYTGAYAYSWGYYYTGEKYNGGGSSYGASYGLNDVIGVAIDMDNQALYFSKNGVYQNSGDPTSGSSKTGAAFTNLSGTIFPCLNGYGGTQVVNFGARVFNTAAPSGYKCLNTANLSDPLIADGSTAMDVVLRVADTSQSKDVTGLNFSPDLVWEKKRDSAGSHYLSDIVRGTTKTLSSDSTAAEGSYSTFYTSFNADGYTIGTGDFQTGSSVVGWAWSAGENSNKTYAVTVSNPGSGNKFYADGALQPTLTLAEGSTYKFDQSSGTNSTHPLRFSTTSDGTHGGGSEYTTGVTTSGTPGSAGAYTQIVIAASAPTLYAYCTNHSGMGFQINTSDTAGYTIPVGGENSSVYNKGRMWSNGASLPSGVTFDQAITNAFNGSRASTARTSTNAALITLTFSPALTVSSSIHIVAEDYAGVSFKYTATVGGTTHTLDAGQAGATFNLSGSLTEITIKSNSGSSRTYLEYVKIDGAELIDSNVTLGDVPSISSRIQADPSKGFSIVEFIADGTAGDTVGHGLNAAPEFIIYKDREYAQNWGAYHGSLGGTKGFNFNTSEAVHTDSGYFNNTNPTNSVITLGTYPGYFGTHDHIAYCFAPVEGYSAFGSYTGNGLADGPMVFTNFRPALVLTKNVDASDDWSIADSSRSPHNVSDESLRPNSSSAEDSSADIDLLSNGFKIRQSNSHRINFSGETFVYIAFAENPFKTARAR